MAQSDFGGVSNEKNLRKLRCIVIRQHNWFEFFEGGSHYTKIKVVGEAISVRISILPGWGKDGWKERI